MHPGCAMPWSRRSRRPAKRSIPGSCRSPPPAPTSRAEVEYISTRGTSPAVSFGAALTQGLAPDGGLYVPQVWPKIPLSAFEGAESLDDVADIFLRPFVEGDALAAEIPAITRDAFNFPAPLVPAGSDGRVAVLELFHGP